MRRTTFAGKYLPCFRGGGNKWMHLVPSDLSDRFSFPAGIDSTATKMELRQIISEKGFDFKALRRCVDCFSATEKVADIFKRNITSDGEVYLTFVDSHDSVLQLSTRNVPPEFLREVLVNSEGWLLQFGDGHLVKTCHFDVERNSLRAVEGPLYLFYREEANAISRAGRFWTEKLFFFIIFFKLFFFSQLFWVVTKVANPWDLFNTVHPAPGGKSCHRILIIKLR